MDLEQSVNNLKQDEVGGNGQHAQQAALEASAEMKRTQELERLEKLINELQEFVQSKVNIHKEIKTKTTGVATALRRYKKLDDEWRATLQRSLRVTPERTGTPALPCGPVVVGEGTELDTGAEADSDSVADEKRISRPTKRKQRTSPESMDKLLKKKKDSGSSPPIKEIPQNPDKNKAPAWEVVLSKKDQKKQRREQHPKQPPRQPLPKPKQKKPRKSASRPEALIIRPKQKDKYSEILRRIKNGVPEDQVRSTVDKLYKTNSGDVLIILSKDNTDKGHALQNTIAAILKDDAEVISKGPQEVLEIRDLDENTTKDDVLAALQKVAGEECQIPAEAIKSLRKAYRGTQTASVTLAASLAQRVLGEHGKIRIGWVNCRIREVKRPIQCYKCWHLGHLAGHCKTKVDRSQLCIKCGQEGHKVAECKNSASCALCTERQGTENTAHHAGTSRCPFFKEALLKLKNRRT